MAGRVSLSLCASTGLISEWASVRPNSRRSLVRKSRIPRGRHCSPPRRSRTGSDRHNKTTETVEARHCSLPAGTRRQFKGTCPRVKKNLNRNSHYGAGSLIVPPSTRWLAGTQLKTRSRPLSLTRPLFRDHFENFEIGVLCLVYSENPRLHHHGLHFLERI